MFLQTAWMVVWEVPIMMKLESKFKTRSTFVVQEHMTKLQEDHFERVYRVLKEQFKILVDWVHSELER